MEFVHKPVLLNECIDNLNIKPNGIYLDGTLGGAGHSLEIAKLLNEKGTLIGIDRDVTAINVSSSRLSGVKPTVNLVNDNYKNIKDVISKLGISGVDGILLDLGVSSYQLDTPERGFSYRYDAPLDMRMNTSDNLTAEYVVNQYTKDELIRIFRDYGEEKWAVRIAQFIEDKRKNSPIKTTFELVDIIKAAIPAGARVDGGHPAKRVFQAIRIEVNGEIESLRNAISDAIECLNPKGRICVISFHSLEDRIVKEVFNEAAKGCVCPPDFPKCVCNKKKVVNILSRKPIISTEDELNENLRAHSAKLRVAEKI
jgi:16S rRNA (cytosine1402-N4)-methyltransferase